MEIIGVMLLAIIAFIVVGFLLVFVIIKLVQNSFERVANRAIISAAGIGHNIANQAAGRLLDVGQKELEKGIDSAKEAYKKSKLESDPRLMATEITKLAKQNRGELAPANVMSALSVNEEVAKKALERMVQWKQCLAEDREEGRVYIFPAFKEKKIVKVCDYCHSRFEKDQAATDCPSCGAKLKEITTF